MKWESSNQGPPQLQEVMQGGYWKIFLYASSGAPYVAIGQDRGALLGNFTNHVFIVYYAQVSKPKTTSR